MGISVAEREWEDRPGGGAAPTRSQPGRAARTKPRYYPNHDGTRFLDLSSDEDYNVGAGRHALPVVQAGRHQPLHPQDIEAEKTAVRYKVFKGLAGAKGGISSGKYTGEWPVMLSRASAS
eukprot:jgi/Tetstr1/434096/TSEL_023240.t1